ncbi:ParB/RepB/Spo0J family partition protein [Variovorax sp. Root411]|uniref:ParB/RepB/Spo0J family partition protein n=1 Tax=Variovorax sp. Root411 TaxID=1736530 RepID=UPI0006F97937|nr:ParB/RepB/Spo0J family partition protein [Variovorax sp. Root411]KQW57077.1 hypothetical protein ASC92_12495 [Variovorax sp. Root411]
MNAPTTPLPGSGAEYLKIDKSSAQREGSDGAPDRVAVPTSPALAQPGLEPHALCAVFPDMGTEDYECLKENVAVNGVLHAIVLLNGQILDGRHRYRAAMELHMECPCIEFAGQDPQQFVIAANAARRNLTASQRAFAIVSVFEWCARGSNQHGGWSPGDHPPKSTAELAKITGLSKSTIKQAKLVEAADMPEVADEVRAGKLSLKRAADKVKTSVRPISSPAALSDPGQPRDAATVLEKPASRLAETTGTTHPQQQSSDQRKENPVGETEAVQQRIRELEGLLASLTKKLADETSRGKDHAEMFAELQQLLNVGSANQVVGEVKRLLSAKEE